MRQASLYKELMPRKEETFARGLVPAWQENFIQQLFCVCVKTQTVTSHSLEAALQDAGEDLVKLIGKKWFGRRRYSLPPAWGLYLDWKESSCCFGLCGRQMQRRDMGSNCPDVNPKGRDVSEWLLCLAPVCFSFRPIGSYAPALRWFGTGVWVSV